MDPHPGFFRLLFQRYLFVRKSGDGHLGCYEIDFQFSPAQWGEVCPKLCRRFLDTAQPRLNLLRMDREKI